MWLGARGPTPPGEPPERPLRNPPGAPQEPPLQLGVPPPCTTNPQDPPAAACPTREEGGTARGPHPRPGALSSSREETLSRREHPHLRPPSCFLRVFWALGGQTPGTGVPAGAEPVAEPTEEAARCCQPELPQPPRSLTGAGGRAGRRRGASGGRSRCRLHPAGSTARGERLRGAPQRGGRMEREGLGRRREAAPLRSGSGRYWGSAGNVQGSNSSATRTNSPAGGVSAHAAKAEGEASRFARGCPGEERAGAASPSPAGIPPACRS